jgi:predicted RNA-binding Zn-ribbon protein involved in translation (DUF1610 family)
MASYNLLRQLRCPSCQWTSICGPEEMLQRLRDVGMLKRQAEPDWPMIIELVTSQADAFKCSECGHTGLVLEEARDDFDDDLVGARLCEVCQQRIPAERLEVLPDSVRCVACQHKPDADEADYCPQCGTPMAVQSSQGRGIARYVSRCPACGYREG